jgi:hypothetical protein
VLGTYIISFGRRVVHHSLPRSILARQRVGDRLTEDRRIGGDVSDADASNRRLRERRRMMPEGRQADGRVSGLAVDVPVVVVRQDRRGAAVDKVKAVVKPETKR